MVKSSDFRSDYLGSTPGRAEYRPHGLVVKIPDCRSGDTSSILVGAVSARNSMVEYHPVKVGVLGSSPSGYV